MLTEHQTQSLIFFNSMILIFQICFFEFIHKSNNNKLTNLNVSLKN